MNARNLRMWLRPGMMIKRWVGLFMLAVVLTSLALAMVAAWIYAHYDFPDGLQNIVQSVTLQFIPHPYRELMLLVGGLSLLVYAIARLSHALISPLIARDPERLGERDRFGEIVQTDDGDHAVLLNRRG